MKHLVSATAGLLLLGRTQQACAQDFSPASSRLFVGTLGGLMAPPSLEIDGKSQPTEGNDIVLGFSAGYLQRLAPHLGLELFGSIGPSTTAWSDGRGESRTRADLALGPVYATTIHLKRPEVSWRIGLPVGYTWAWFHAGKGRAVDESYSDGRGLNVSLTSGFDFFGHHHGAYLDGSYSMHLTWIDHHAVLKSDPSVRSDETYRYLEHTFVVGIGYLYRF